MTTGEMDMESMPPEPNPESSMGRLARVVSNFGMREWLFIGIGTQVLALALVQLFITFWPHEKVEPRRLSDARAMQFVEFQEIRQKQPTEVQDLSDKIIEKEKKEKVNPINWNNAVDPTFAAETYRPLFRSSFSPRDYPQAARRGNLPTVRARYEMLIGADGKIKDVRIKWVRSRGGAHKPYEGDFKKAVRKIILRKTRMITRPYIVDGKAVPFVWTQTIEFELQ